MKKHKNIIIYMLVTVIMMFGFSIDVSAASAKNSVPITDGMYKVVSMVNNSYVWDINGGSTANGGNLQLYKDNGSNAQKFIFTRNSDGYYTITNVNSNKVIDCDNAGKANGTNIKQYQQNNSDAQKWQIKSVGNGYYTLICKCNGKVADVYNGTAANGTNIHMYQSNGTAAQKFKLEKTNIADGTYKVVSGINSKYVWDIDGGSIDNGANLQLYEDNNTNAQKFKFTKNSDGHYTITNINSNKVIDCDNSGSANGTNIKQYSSNNSSAQRWEVRSAGNGYYMLICKCNGKAADVYNGVAGNGANIHMYQTNGTNAQKFKLIATNPVSSNSTMSSISSTMTNALYKINTSASKITCGFDGYVNTKGRHEGIDFKYGNGKPVYSLTDGVITRVTNGYNGSNGLSTIAIYDSENNKTVVYLHSQPLSSLRVNQNVSRGQQIATESWRGVSSSSASHTHVEVRDGRRTSAAKSVNDYKLENANPTSYWKSLGYDVK